MRIHWVSRVPAPSGSSVNRHVAAGSLTSSTAHSTTCGGSHTVIVDVVSQPPMARWRLRPTKRAPTRGPVAPSSHSTPWSSALNRGGRSMSLTKAQTTDGDAVMSTTASVVGPSA